MIRLEEAQTKEWLRSRGLPVPWGMAVSSGAEASASAAVHPGPVMLKAMVPTGRRGKAGAVRPAGDGTQRQQIACSLLGATFSGHRTESVYVEEWIEISQEFYLAFVLGDEAPEVLLSCKGGVDIEEVIASDPQALVRQPIDPLSGLSVWAAIDLWHQAGVRGELLPRLGEISAKLYLAFRAADAVMLEINPLAVTRDRRLMLVGAMMAVDAAALHRQAHWQASVLLPAHPRERAVAQANLAFEGGECQYTELSGEIGLLVGGGGAGLYLHDQVLACGGAPANHCVTPPMGSDLRKLKAVISAILENPALRGLLVAFNFAQMARADLRVRTLVEVLDEKGIAPGSLPIVIRLFGGGEQVARELVEGRPNVHYLPRGTTLAEAAALIVRLTTAHRDGLAS